MSVFFKKNSSFLFPLLISSIPTLSPPPAPGFPSELAPRLHPASSPRASFPRARPCLLPPSSPRAHEAPALGGRRGGVLALAHEEAREAAALARAAALAHAVAREATCSPRWVPPSSSSRAPVLLPPILSRAAARPELTRAAAAHLGGSLVWRGRRRSPHARRRSPGPGAEVIGSGRSLHARRRPGRGGAHASSSTPVSPCFFLLPQLRQAPAPHLVLLTHACGPCSTRPTRTVPVRSFLRGEPRPDLQRIFARGTSSSPLDSDPNSARPRAVPSHPSLS